MTTLYPVLPQLLPVHPFMVEDILGSLLGVVAFPALLYAPGYVASYAANLSGFRDKGFAERSLWAIATSFCLSPVAAYLVGHSAGLGCVCAVAVMLSLAAAMLIVRERRGLQWPRRDRGITALIGFGWTLLVVFLLVDFQVGRKLYYSVVMADQSYRIAFTDAVVRTGVPPANPLYFAGSPAPMRYYYFWYVLCAAVVKLAHISARQSFIASSVWAGFGLLATVQLFSTHFFRWERKQRRLAWGLLLVTGADLIPAMGQALLQPTLNGDTEWWSVDPIDGWPDSLLWVPHHVASVLCCLLGFLLLWGTVQPATRPARRWAVVFAALAFASAFGLSVYVTFGFALMLLLWLVRLWMTRDAARGRLTVGLLAAGALSLLCLLPFLHELAGPGRRVEAAGTAASDFPFAVSVRRMIDSELLTGLPALSRLNRSHPVLLDQGLRLLLLTPGLAMELGLYGAVLVMLLLAKRRLPTSPREPARDTSLFLACCGLLLTMFVSSAVITNNDFGYRAVMLPQFFLLLLTADLLGSWRGHGTALVRPAVARRRLLYGLLGLGVLGTVYWATLLRAWLPIEAAKASDYRNSPADEYQIRDAFEQLSRMAPTDAVIAFRPIDPTPDRQGAVMVPNEYYQRMLVMDAGRQILNAEGKCAVHFGGDPAACPMIQSAVRQMYAMPQPPGASEARQRCRQLGVEYLAVSPWDAAWQARTGWPVTLPVVVEEPRFHILSCR